MTVMSHINQQLHLKNIVITTLILFILFNLFWLSNKYTYQIDISTSSSNTLSFESQKLLNLLPEPIRITAFIEKGQSIRSQISQLVDRFKYQKQDISLLFIDPQLHPEQIKDLKSSAKDIILVEYQNRVEKLNYIDEESLSHALSQLANLDTHLLKISPKTNIGTHLNLSNTQIMLLNAFNMLILPLFFLVTGFIIWHKRKSA